MMDKKYTVFVSSTYEDLKDERSKVISALLQMDCFPVGMEYFNASDHSQWEVIQSLIRECDYYVLIVGGKYGSVEQSSGKSYTQLEYEYARSLNIPTIAFVHKDPQILPAVKVGTHHVKELEAFRSLVSKHLWRSWTNADELAGQVALSLNSLKMTSPRCGWIKADRVSSDEANATILTLRNQIEQLQIAIMNDTMKAPAGTELLAQGDDIFEVDYRYMNFTESLCSYSCSWNDIYQVLAPSLYIECADGRWAPILNEYIKKQLAIKCKSMEKVGGVYVMDTAVQKIKTQFIALGLIQESDKKHTAKEGNSFWMLTPYGRYLLIQLGAIKKK